MDSPNTTNIGVQSQPPQEAQPLKQKLTLDEVRTALFSGYGKRGTLEEQMGFKKLLRDYLNQEAEANKVASKYNIVVLFDNTRIIKSDADKIYRAASNLSKNGKPLLVVLVSNGGEPGSAYLIGKLCRSFSNGKFIVVVPRHAKSAATLLACAGDEIHVGNLSELGPIDPQIDEMPALGLKNAIEHIVELVAKTPSSGDMFAKYLKATIQPVQIGYYERVAESAIQYAERLLDTHAQNLVNQPHDIATKLVRDYKDHGFVIDTEEAGTIFGPKTIKIGTDEYLLGNLIYNILSEVESTADLLGYRFYLIGQLDTDPSLFKKKD